MRHPVYEYHGWKYYDRGEGCKHPGERWTSTYAGVRLTRGSEMALRAAIDARRVRYPNSNGA